MHVVIKAVKIFSALSVCTHLFLYIPAEHGARGPQLRGGGGGGDPAPGQRRHTRGPHRAQHRTGGRLQVMYSTILPGMGGLDI